jgi:DNA polymerase-3 subunit gamma/tau
MEAPDYERDGITICGGPVMSELALKYRPQKLEQMVGQPRAVAVLKGFLGNGVPHAILFTGPPGTGKTTAARILTHALNCHKRDVLEMNAADTRGIDTIREIHKRVHLRPLNQGGSRAWILDEAHKLTNDAQNSFLKMLEDDRPEHAYFMLASTEPHKLLKTVRDRCRAVHMEPVPAAVLQALVNRVAVGEGRPVDATVALRVAELADGSPRKALMLLELVLPVQDVNAAQEILQKHDLQVQAIDLARLLVNPRSRWPEVAQLLKGLEGEDPEAVRRLVLGYARAVLLNRGDSQSFMVIQSFRDPFYDGTATMASQATLAAACYEVVSKRK